MRVILGFFFVVVERKVIGDEIFGNGIDGNKQEQKGGEEGDFYGVEGGGMI